MSVESAVPAIPLLPVASAEQKAKIAKVSRDYEQSFLSIMLNTMSAGVKTTSFGGGEGEDAFKSFMNDAMAKSMVGRGGIGLAPRLQAELLQLQGLSA